MEEKLEVYVHIPFCVQKCAYCDFLSSAQSVSVQERYVGRLIKEIRQAGKEYGNVSVPSVFVGGGTPSILKAEWMTQIFDALRQSFRIEDGAEISMEANPGTVTKEKLAAYRKAGINRLSFGLQSADNRELRLLGRIHTYEEFLESYRLAREAGFANLNIDLMSALPGQTVSSWKETLLRVAALEPEHISAYSLIIEEGTPFYEMYGADGGNGLLPDEDSEREMYHLTKEILRQSGFERYEISNYAKPGKACRHNIGYWTGVPYLGLGLGASSYVGGVRFVNEEDLESYVSGKARGRTDVQALSEKERQEEFFFLGLRLAAGVSLEKFRQIFHVDAETVYPGLFERLIREGAALREGDRFCLTDYGFDVSNYVMAEFLQD